MPVLLEARALAVRRGRRTVLRDVDLSLASGSAVHLAGANGSGKTSLLRVLAGIAAPSAGALRRDATCAFVPERVQLAAALRPGEWLRAMRGLRRLAPADWGAAAEASGLEGDVLARPAATLSRGMLQRIALLEAVRSGCPLLFLDEPFSGLDGDGRGWLAAELADRRDGGAAIVLTDHSGSAAGRIALDAALELRDGACAERAAPRAATAALVAVRAAHGDGRRLERAVPEAEVDDLLRGLLGDGWHVEEVRP